MSYGTQNNFGTLTTGPLIGDNIDKTNLIGDNGCGSTVFYLP